MLGNASLPTLTEQQFFFPNEPSPCTGAYEWLPPPGRILGDDCITVRVHQKTTAGAMPRRLDPTPISNVRKMVN